MEGTPENKEGFESFKSRIEEIYKTEGKSQRLFAEFDAWYDKRLRETEAKDVAFAESIIFQIERVQIFLAAESYGSAFNTISDTLDQIFTEKAVKTKELARAQADPNEYAEWRNLQSREDSYKLSVEDVSGEIEKLKDYIERLDVLNDQATVLLGSIPPEPEENS